MYTGKETVSEGRNAIVVAPDVLGSSLSVSGISRFFCMSYMEGQRMCLNRVGGGGRFSCCFQYAADGHT